MTTAHGQQLSVSESMWNLLVCKKLRHSCWDGNVQEKQEKQTDTAKVR